MKQSRFVKKIKTDTHDIKPRKKWIYEPVYEGLTEEGDVIEGVSRNRAGKVFLCVMDSYSDSETRYTDYLVDTRSLRATGRYILGFDD